MSVDPKFKKLQDYWYKKAAQAGHEEIEDGPYLTTWSAFFQSRYKPDKFHAIHDYYYYASQFLQTGKFNNKKEKHIWELHTQAIGSRDIARSLKRKGYRKISKDTVLAVIRQLKGRFFETKS